MQMEESKKVNSQEK